MSAPIVLEIKPPATIATENVKAALLEWVEKLDDLKIIGATFVMVSTDSSVHVQNVTDRSLTQIGAIDVAIDSLKPLVCIGGLNMAKEMAMND